MDALAVLVKNTFMVKNNVQVKCNSVSAVYAWWLIFKMILSQSLDLLAEKDQPTSENSNVPDES